MMTELLTQFKHPTKGHYFQHQMNHWFTSE